MQHFRFSVAPTPTAAGPVGLVGISVGTDCYRVPDVGIDFEEELNETAGSAKFPPVDVEVVERR